MSELFTLKATVRPKIGKRNAQLMRRQGQLPAIVYGYQKPVHAIGVELRVFLKLLHSKRFYIQPITLIIDETSQQVLPRDVQFSPISDIPIHVDFLAIDEHMKIKVQIPCEFINHEKCPGLKRGGLLNVIRHSIDVTCLATHIPPMITIDLSGFNITDSIHISNVQLPEDVKPIITKRDFTIATISSPSGGGG